LKGFLITKSPLNGFSRDHELTCCGFCKNSVAKSALFFAIINAFNPSQPSSPSFLFRIQSMSCSLFGSRSLVFWVAVSLLATPLPIQSPLWAQEEFEIYDNEPSKLPRLTPEQAAQNWKLPSGFTISLFAEEPSVQQPISMCWDAHGRMWVVENYTYADAQTNFDLRMRDRVLVFSDTNRDGRFDERTVFWDQGQRITSVEVGLNGVWLLAAPNLLFISDKDQNMIPDGEPTVVLDGFDADRVRHNLVNGLRWGPDGWLYGRHGILATSFVGTPGSDRSQRVPLNCGVWRYHPTAKKFEVYTHGTTNPWGMDWNDDGELFFINTVIGHLWQAIPGAHLERMYGEDLNPYVFKLIPQTADHVHWDSANEKWMDIRKLGVTDATDKAGGGHAHCGLMFYLGGAWPEEYRNELFTLNYHGRRLNQDHIEREGASFVGRHRPDFAFSPDPWFRPIDLTYGPDGAVYILDWSDAGECHDNDGVHRHSGRIFRIAYDTSSRPSHTSTPLLAGMSSQELAELYQHSNEWFVRQSRQTLATRATNGEDMLAVTSYFLKHLGDKQQPSRLRLRALWGLNAVGGLDQAQLSKLIADKDEALAAAAIRLAIDRCMLEPSSHEAWLETFIQAAASSESSLVKLYLSSALQYTDGERWWTLAESLVAQETLREDRTYPLLVWYGIEAKLARSPDRALALIQRSKLPLVTTFIVRRLGLDVDQWSTPLDAILAWGSASDETHQRAILDGLSQAASGRVNFPPLAAWKNFADQVQHLDQGALKPKILEIGLLLGEGRNAAELMKMITDGNVELPIRRQAITALARQRSAGLRDLLINLISDRDLGVTSLDALAIVGTPDDAERIVNSFNSLQPAGKEAAVRLLASRKNSAETLLQAVTDNKISRQNIQATTLRQLQVLGDDAWNQRIVALFPDANRLTEDKRKQMASLHHLLSSGANVAPDPGRGRKLFDASCAKCHRLFGTGGQVGPELTGSQRSNLHYLVENIIDPSAQLADTYRLSILRLEDGRVLMGVVLQKNDQTLVLQTAEDKVTIPVVEIEEMQQTTKSLMPEGLLDSLSEQQIRDLFAYLQSSQQVATKE
jgi:putative membrane-bound dehydrogenase-like protein